MEAIEIREELKQFHGTAEYYKHLFPGKSPILLTDGCKFIRDECKAYYFFNFRVLGSKQRKSGF